MSKGKRKPNPLDPSQIQRLRLQIEQGFPWAHQLYASVYVHDPNLLGLTGSQAFINVFEGATVEIRDSATARIYRKADVGRHDLDVDEIRTVDGHVVTFPAKRDIDNHHLTGSFAQDVMQRNNISFELRRDPDGQLSLNVRPDGTVATFINFEPERDPRNRS